MLGQLFAKRTLTRAFGSEDDNFFKHTNLKVRSEAHF
jgi:hypothetical protein